MYIFNLTNLLKIRLLAAEVTKLHRYVEMHLGFEYFGDMPPRIVQ